MSPVPALRCFEIPILVPCFNAVTYARGMTQQLSKMGYKNIVLLDNASTYPPMLDFLASPGPCVTVVMSAENKGPRSAFLDKAFYDELPDMFCLSDPDLVFGKRMPHDFVASLVELTEVRGIGKAGLAMDISDRSKMRNETFLIDDQMCKIWEWEAQFWQDRTDDTPQGDPVYVAPIDTTFAVYNKKYFDPRFYMRAVRVAGRFTCRHLPWYRNTGLKRDEEAYYRRVAKTSYYLRSDGKQAVVY